MVRYHPVGPIKEDNPGRIERQKKGRRGFDFIKAENLDLLQYLLLWHEPRELFLAARSAPALSLGVTVTDASVTADRVCLSSALRWDDLTGNG